MADIAELERRVTALEVDTRRDAKGLRNDVQGLRDDVQGLQRDVQAAKRDGQHNADLLVRMEKQLTDIHARVVANELTATSNARQTEQAFSELKGDIAKVNGRLDRVETEIGGVKADVASLRRDLPSMIAETMREVLKESRS
jgi:chromosome segregation ATPase